MNSAETPSRHPHVDFTNSLSIPRSVRSGDYRVRRKAWNTHRFRMLQPGVHARKTITGTVTLGLRAVRKRLDRIGSGRSGVLRCEEGVGPRAIQSPAQERSRAARQRPRRLLYGPSAPSVRGGMWGISVSSRSLLLSPLSSRWRSWGSPPLARGERLPRHRAERRRDASRSSPAFLHRVGRDPVPTMERERRSSSLVGCGARGGGCRHKPAAWIEARSARPTPRRHYDC